MNRTKLFSTTRIAGVISLLFMSGAVLAETAEMSKLKGAVGNGVTKAYEAKTNQFCGLTNSTYLPFVITTVVQTHTVQILIMVRLLVN
jgi:hypothetical protein